MPNVVSEEKIHQIRCAVLGHQTHPMTINQAAVHFGVDWHNVCKITHSDVRNNQKSPKKVLPPKLITRRKVVKKLTTIMKNLDGRKILAYTKSASMAKELELNHNIKVSYKTLQRDAPAEGLKVYVRPKLTEAGSNPDVVKRRVTFVRSCRRKYTRLVPGVPFSRLFIFSGEHVSTANDHRQQSQSVHHKAHPRLAAGAQGEAQHRQRAALGRNRVQLQKPTCPYRHRTG